MKHKNRWDLPKGHVDPGETDLECALRELVEETGIAESQIDLDPDFRFQHFYRVQSDRGKRVNKKKELLVYLGWLNQDVEIVLTEHIGFEWIEWNPPHKIQEQTIDPLLNQVHDFFSRTQPEI